MRSGYQRKRIVAMTLAAAVAVGFVAYALEWREDRSIPPGPPEVAGRLLMEKRKCLRCHKVDGYGGLVGPDLTAVATRIKEPRMDAVLTDPKSVDEKAKMPKPRLTDEQRAVIVAYLRTLHGLPH